MAKAMAAISMTPSTTSPPLPRTRVNDITRRAAPQKLRQEGYHADKDDRDDQEPAVAVHDVRQLMGEDRLDLVRIKLGEQARGDGDRVAARVDAARIGVHRRAVDDIERGIARPREMHRFSSWS